MNRAATIAIWAAWLLAACATGAFLGVNVVVKGLPR